MKYIKCKKCLDIITSKHVHDFVRCKCGNIFIDGGNDYTRVGWGEGRIDDSITEVTEEEYNDKRE